MWQIKCKNRNKKLFIISGFLIVAVLAATIYYLFWHKPNFIDVNSSVEEKEDKGFVRLLFVGDIMFDRGIRYYADKNKGNQFIFEKVSEFLKNNDLVIANLEGPITNEKSISAGTAPGSKNNYFFTFDPSLAKTLFNNNIRLVNLGNNHILNFGNQGLGYTEIYLHDAYVDYFGAPNGQKGVIKEINGVKIAFVSYNEFAELDSKTNKKATLEEIQKVKNLSDIIIVFSHWGAEYTGPDQAMENLARQFLDSGADLVVGSHSHIIEPVEIYKGKRIYYSLGNFIFDQYFSEDVRNGLGVAVKIDKQTKQMEFAEHKFYLQSNGQTILKYGE